MKKKLTLIFSLTLVLTSCGGSMVKVNQAEIAKNKAELEAKNQKKEIESLEADKTKEKSSKKTKKDKSKKKLKLEEDSKTKKTKNKNKDDKKSNKKNVKNKNTKENENKNTKNNNENSEKNTENTNQDAPKPSQNNSSRKFVNSDTSDNSSNHLEVLNDLNGKKFVFSSGAGGWQTVLNFSENGNFTAKYEDYDFDSVAICEFNGKLSIDSKVNETAYILRLDRSEITTPINTEEVKNIGGKNMTVRYVDLPYGFAVNNDSDHSFQGMFSLYLPLRKRSEMSAEVNHWLDITGEKNVEKDISRIYLLVNNKTIDTFREKVE